MKSYRITKYNPVYRNEKDIYKNIEWTSFYDIDKCFNGERLGISEYISVENSYINAIILFMKENNITELVVNSLEKAVELNEIAEKIEKYKEYYSRDMLDLFNSINEGDILNINNIQLLCKLILREHIWCKLECSSKMFVHFGYDYYMYIGSLNGCSIISENTIRNDLGLYMEEFESPYKEI